MPAIFTHPPFVGAVTRSSSSAALLAAVARVAPLLVLAGDSPAELLPAGCEYWVELDQATAEAAIALLDAGASRIVTRSAELAGQLALPDRVILKIDIDSLNGQSDGVLDTVAGVLVDLPEGNADHAENARLLSEFRQALGGKKKADSKLLFFASGTSASVQDVSTMAQLDSKAVPCVQLDKLSTSDVATLFTAGLKTDRTDGLFATLVAGHAGGEPLGLVYSSHASLAMSVESGDATYYSRSRNSLWKKGETSGATQKVRRIRIDCDADALQFEVEQKVGTGFCQYVLRSPPHVRSYLVAHTAFFFALAAPCAPRHALDTRPASRPWKRQYDNGSSRHRKARIPRVCSRIPAW